MSSVLKKAEWIVKGTQVTLSFLKNPTKNRLSNKRANSGFTLIELLVVIAIIALLMGVLVPALIRARKAAKRVVCSSRMHQISLAFQIYVDFVDVDCWDDSFIHYLNRF